MSDDKMKEAAPDLYEALKELIRLVPMEPLYADAMWDAIRALNKADGRE